MRCSPCCRPWSAPSPGTTSRSSKTHHRHKAGCAVRHRVGPGARRVRTPAANLWTSVRATAARAPPRERPDEIGIHAVRAGGNPGEHAVILTGDGEEIRLSHRAFSRASYAEGRAESGSAHRRSAAGMVRAGDAAGISLAEKRWLASMLRRAGVIRAMPARVRMLLPCCKLPNWGTTERNVAQARESEVHPCRSRSRRFA